MSVSGSGVIGVTGTGPALGRSPGNLAFTRSQTVNWIPTLAASNIITAIGFASGTLAASGTVTLDLAGGTVLDLAGDGITFATIKGITVWLLSSTGETATEGSLEVGGAGSDPHPLWFKNVSDIARVEVGGPPFAQGAEAGIAVNSGQRNVLITNPSLVSASYAVLVWGTV